METQPKAKKEKPPLPPGTLKFPIYCVSNLSKRPSDFRWKFSRLLYTLVVVEVTNYQI